MKNFKATICQQARHWKRNTLILLLLNVLILGAFSGYISYRSQHLRPYNNNTKMLAYDENEPKLAGRKIVFYRDNCIDCQRELPAAHILNTLTLTPAIYLNVNESANLILAKELRLNWVPTAMKAHYKNGAIYSYNRVPMMQTWQKTVLSLEIIVFETVLWLSILLGVERYDLRKSAKGKYKKEL